MIKITEKADLKGLSSYPKAHKYISKLLEDLLSDYSEYCADCSIRAIGAIYFMECLKDFEDYKSLGLEQSLEETTIEWTNVKENICVICVVISNDYTINIVCETSLYKQWCKSKGQP